MFRHSLAVVFACTIVIGVPLMSILQFAHLHSTQGRKTPPLPAFQIRAIDRTSKPIHIFREPLISVTFDDGYETTYQAALPILQRRGIISTQYVLSGVEDNPLYLSWEQIKLIQTAGHEIGCHTISHPDLRTLDDQAVMQQLQGCKTTLEKRFGPITDFASPYGSEDARTLSDIKKVFVSQRNTNGDSSNGVTDADVNTAAYFDPNNIIGMTVKRNTTLLEFQQLINYTIANNGWLVLTYHQADEGLSKYGQDPAELDQQMAVLQRAPVRIVTVHQAITSWQATK